MNFYENLMISNELLWKLDDFQWISMKTWWFPMIFNENLMQFFPSRNPTQPRVLQERWRASTVHVCVPNKTSKRNIHSINIITKFQIKNEDINITIQKKEEKNHKTKWHPA